MIETAQGHSIKWNKLDLVVVQSIGPSRAAPVDTVRPRLEMASLPEMERGLGVGPTLHGVYLVLLAEFPKSRPRVGTKPQNPRKKTSCLTYNNQQVLWGY